MKISSLTSIVKIPSFHVSTLEKMLHDRYPADFFPNFRITLKSPFLFSHDLKSIRVR